MRLRRPATGALMSAIALIALGPAAGSVRAQHTADTLSLVQMLGYPFPTSLSASPAGSRIAWVFNQEGRRNIWTADAPDYAAAQVTRYADDDGEELTWLNVSADGRSIIYVRGGDHDGNWSGDGPPNPASSTEQPKVQIWAVSTAGGVICANCLSDSDS